MFTRRIAIAAGFAAGLAALPATAQQPVEIQFWHGLAQPLGGQLEQIVADYNASQQRFRVVPSFRGGYPETMVAAIAAFRANTAPHIVQMFEVGTGTMMAAGRAVRPVYQVLADANITVNFGDYLPAIAGYYQSADGRQMSLPFNSSTAVMFWNKDHFRRAGLNPDEPPQTWEQVAAAAQRLKAAGIACPVTTSWPAWVQVEQMSALHNVPLATQGNGFGGLNAELAINNPLMVRHLNNLITWQREGLFRYGGRDSAGDALFPNGECSITMASSGVRSRTIREARFEWGTAMLPYYADVAGAPRNSIIGGASFWVLNRGPQGGATGGRSADEWRGTAEFLAFLARPEVAARWHTETGFLPVTRTAFEQVRATGFYQQNPGADVPIEQLLRGGGQMTENTRGIRLGGYVEIRNIMQEEMEKAFQGQQTAQQALDAAVRRANVVLRNFERQNRN